jgi:hypothetical protein
MMNAERRLRKANRIERGEPRFGSSGPGFRLLAAGLALSLIAVSVLSLGGVSVAAPVDDVPCTECSSISDPLAYTNLQSRLASERDASVAASAARWKAIARSFALGSDPASMASAARYSGLAAMYAAESEMGVASSAGLSIGDASDPVQYTFLAADRSGALDAAFLAYAARLQGLADCYAPSNLICSIK